MDQIIVLENDQNIAEDYRIGLTWKQLKEKYDCSQKKIRNALRRTATSSSRKIGFGDIEEAGIVADYQLGFSSIEIANKYHRSKYGILNVLKRNEIVRRSTSEACRIYPINESAFDDMEDEDALYWAGFLMADGNLFNKEGHEQWIVQVCLNQRDTWHLDKLRKFLGTTIPIRIDGKKRDARKVSISSKLIFHKLCDYGLTPRKSKTARLADSVASNRHMWRGMIDGDGSIYTAKRDNSRRISLVGSLFSLEQFQKFLWQKLNIRKNIYKHKTIYQIAASGEDAFRIIKYLYEDANTYLDRKYSRACEVIEYGKNKYDRRLLVY